MAGDLEQSRNIRIPRMIANGLHPHPTLKVVMMPDRRLALLAATVGVVFLEGAAAEIPMIGSALAQIAPSAAAPGGLLANDRLVQLGPEGQALAKRAGTWDASFTSWDKPGAAPVTTGGLVAEREMIGPMLEERLHSAPEGSGPSWTRIDDITFNRTEGRWDYMSMDTRIAAGMMSAWSLDHDPAERIFVSFLPFSIPGEGSNVTGQMLRMEQVIIRQDDDHDVKDQYFTAADGVGTKWLAKRYSYVRRPS